MIFFTASIKVQVERYRLFHGTG